MKRVPRGDQQENSNIQEGESMESEQDIRKGKRKSFHSSRKDNLPIGKVICLALIISFFIVSLLIFITMENAELQQMRKKTSELQLPTIQQTHTNKPQAYPQPNSVPTPQKSNINLVQVKKKRIIYNRITQPRTTQQQLNDALQYRKLMDNPEDPIGIKQYEYYDKKYSLGRYKELPFCVVMTSYNNNANKRVENSLNSVFIQNYTNYHVVYIDDFSTDGTADAVQKYIADHPKIKDKIVLIRNKESMRPTYNYFLAANKYCKREDIYTIVDGDDELIGKQVLNTLNTVFQDTKVYFIYTNIAMSWGSMGYSSPFPDNIIENNDYRRYPFVSGHLQAFYTELYLKIDEKHLKDTNGKWFQSAGDVVFCIPLLELSHNRMLYLPQINYYYNAQTGINDHTIRLGQQKGVDNFVRSYPKLQPVDRLFDKNPYESLGFNLQSDLPTVTKAPQTVQKQGSKTKEPLPIAPKQPTAVVPKQNVTPSVPRQTTTAVAKLPKQPKSNKRVVYDRITQPRTTQQQLNDALQYRKLMDNPEDPIGIKQYEYYDKKYSLGRYKELPFCVVMTSYNNNANKRVENSLNSVFIQNYTNYHVVYIDDFSTDGTADAVQKYIADHPKIKDKIVLIRNKESMRPTYNYFLAANKYCKREDIYTIVDGDDELIGKQVLNTLNTVFQDTKVYFIYTNIAMSWGSMGYSSPFPDNIIENNDYRRYPFVSGHLQAFYTELYLKIDEKHLKDTNGKWFQSAGDVVFCIPLLELSHNRMLYLPQINYYYNAQTGINDHTIRLGQQKGVDNFVRSYPKLQPVDRLFDKNPYESLGFNLQSDLPTVTKAPQTVQKQGSKTKEPLPIAPKQPTAVVPKQNVTPSVPRQTTTAVAKLPKQPKSNKRVVYDRITQPRTTQQQLNDALQYRKLMDNPEDPIGIKQYEYYDKKYSLGRYKELPFCVVMTSYNNNANKRVENSLNSVFIQNYTNYHVVYIDDFSTDGTADAVQKYIADHPKIKDKIVLIRNKESMRPTYNYFLAANKYCKREDIYTIVDGDDELIGKQVLNTLNTVFQDTKVYFIYTNIAMSWGSMGYSSPFPDNIIENNDYRRYPFVSGHLQAFYTELYLKIDEKHLKDTNGKWFQSAGDVVFCIPLLELSHNRMLYLPQINYYYNAQTGINDHTIRLGQQKGVDNFVRSYPKLQPVDRLFDKNPYESLGFLLDADLPTVTKAPQVSPSNPSSPVPQTPVSQTPISPSRLPHSQRSTVITQEQIKQFFDFRKLKNFPNDPLAKVQYEYYDKKYEIGKYTKQLPFCIVTSAYNVNHHDLQKNNLNSIFNQNYTNYHVVYFDDASTDGTHQQVQAYVKDNPHIRNKIKIFKSVKNVKALVHYIEAANTECKPEQIFLIVDGDDQLVGLQVLKLYNALFQQTKALFMYSSCLDSNGGTCRSAPHQPIVKEQNTYRSAPWITEHLQATYTELVRRIKDSDLKKTNGQYFISAQDVVISIPTLEMSHRRVQFIPELPYLWNTQTGINDHVIRWPQQKSTELQVRRYAPYHQVTDWDPYINQEVNQQTPKKNTQTQEPLPIVPKQPTAVVPKQNAAPSVPRQTTTAVVELPKQPKSNKRVVYNRITQQGTTQQQLNDALQYRKLMDNPEDPIGIKQYEYYDKKYSLGRYKELPFCVVMTSYNNNANKRVENSLNSVFIQNYTNYHVVYIDDFSTDGTADAVQKYIADHPKIKDKIVLIRNKESMRPTYNYFLAANKYCKREDIYTIVDGDDELIGKQVLNTLNTVFQDTKVYFIYTNIAMSWGSMGYSSPFPDNIIENNDYRRYPFVSGHLQAFYTELYLKIDEKHLKDTNGKWFQSAGDVVFCIPLLELSHNRMLYLPQINYYYNAQTGINDHTIRLGQQKGVDNFVRSYPKLQPVDRLFDKNPYESLGFNLQSDLPTVPIVPKQPTAVVPKQNAAPSVPRQTTTAVVELPKQPKSNKRVVYNRITQQGTTQQQLNDALQYRKLMDNPEDPIGIKQYEYYDKKYSLGRYKELPFCVVMTSYNNNANKRVENSLNSVFIQNYTNYHVVYIDDFSTDGTADAVQKYIADHPKIKDKIVLIRNKESMRPTYNYFLAANKYCKREDIYTIVDGDDELIGKQVLNTLNTVFQDTKVYFIYTNIAMSWGSMGYSSPFPDNIIENNDYRRYPFVSGHLQAFYTELYLKIDEKHLKDTNGKWFQSAGDVVFCIPLLELSHNRMLYLPQINYYYNAQTGINDHTIRLGQQKGVDNFVRSYPKLQPVDRLFDKNPYESLGFNLQSDSK